MDGLAQGALRDANGRFIPGHSGNPAGKKAGTRNRATVLREALADGEDTAAARIVIDKALSGDAVAARFIVDRLMPRDVRSRSTCRMAEQRRMSSHAPTRPSPQWPPARSRRTRR
jgi:hypothetical protein